MDYSVTSPHFKAAEVSVPQPTTVDDIVIPETQEEYKNPHVAGKYLTGAAFLATGAYLLYNGFFKKGKISEKTLEAFRQQGNTIKNGIAKCKDGTMYSGSITHTTKGGDEFCMEYLNGKLQKVSKNVDTKGFNNPEKASSYIKTYEYTPEGKLKGFQQTTFANKDIPVTQKDISIPNVTKLEQFKAEGGKFEEGKALNADGTAFNGVIVDKTENGSMLIKEYNDGKQVSERLNTTLKNNVVKKGTEHYSYNEQDLIKREEEYIKSEQEKIRLEAERIKKDQERLRFETEIITNNVLEKIRKEKEMNSIKYKLKEFFKRLFNNTPKTEEV